jgi:segregation and condensation protein B
VTPDFLDQFGLESARDLPGLKELRSAGLLENRPPPSLSDALDEEREDSDENQTELFEE